MLPRLKIIKCFNLKPARESMVSSPPHYEQRSKSSETQAMSRVVDVGLYCRASKLTCVKAPTLGDGRSCNHTNIFPWEVNYTPDSNFAIVVAGNTACLTHKIWTEHRLWWPSICHFQLEFLNFSRVLYEYSPLQQISLGLCGRYRAYVQSTTDWWRW